MSRDSQSSEADPDMRGVLRSLAVLRELNRHNGATILELHRATGISRTALYRIATTLARAGYVTVDDDTQRLRLTSLVKQLSDGYEEAAWVTDIAGPILDHLQQEVIWPTDLFSFFDDTMIMRRTTRRTSPWTIDRVAVGFRIPLLNTACGRAYLAHVPEPVVDGVLQRLRHSSLPDRDLACEPKAVHLLLAKVRQDGYALREAAFMKETGSIAFPVLVDGVARCSVAITYISSAVTPQTAIDRFGPLLKRAAADIGQQVSDQAI